MEMLRYAEVRRDPADFFDEMPAAEPQWEMVDLAAQLIDQRTAPPITGSACPSQEPGSSAGGETKKA